MKDEVKVFNDELKDQENNGQSKGGSTEMKRRKLRNMSTGKYC